MFKIKVSKRFVVTRNQKTLETVQYVKPFKITPENKCKIKSLEKCSQNNIVSF